MLPSCMSTATVLGIYGPSDSGKTTLIVKLVHQLTKEHFHVATIKCTKKSFSLDTKGKDTWKHRNAGAELVVLSSAGETDFLVHASMATSEILRTIAAVGWFDLVLVEGANDPEIPKIQIGAGKKRKNTIACYTNNFHEIVQIIKKEMKKGPRLHQVTIHVDGKNIGLTAFPEYIIANTITGMISSLKGVRTMKDVTITLKR